MERWNALVNQGNDPCWLRKFRVAERSLRPGDPCCVVGVVRRRRADGGTGAARLELHCGEEGLLLTNTLGASRALPPRRVPTTHATTATRPSGPPPAPISGDAATAATPEWRD